MFGMTGHPPSPLTLREGGSRGVSHALRLNIIPASWFDPQIFWKDVTNRRFWRECCVILWHMQSTMLNERQSQVSA